MERAMATSVYIIESRTEVLKSIRSVLETCQKVRITGESEKWHQSLGKSASPPDVLLLGTNGSSREAYLLLSEIRRQSNGIKIIFLVDELEEPAFLSRLLLTGLNGYMTKNAGVEEMEFAIEKVSLEGIYICTGFALKVLEKYPLPDGIDKPLPYNLTEGELSVLRLIAEGHINKDIANALFVSVRTIESRRKKLLEKTNTVNTATLIRQCVKAGLVL
jgi:DNA-binding NarL/FixJ family response regulator